MPRYFCDHCGLPVVASAKAEGERLYCCYGCRLASHIVGDQEHPQRAWQILRLSVSALLAMNVMMIALLLYTHSTEREAVPTFRWIMLVAATPVMLLMGYPFAAGAWAEIRRRRLSLDTLVFLGSFAAFASSAWNVLAGRGEVYFDTATMLPVLVTFGKLIEATAKSRAGRLVRSLETLLPATAVRIDADGEREVELSQLRVGDRLHVRPGERIPSDGVILEGSTTIEQAAFTGEAQPKLCGNNDDVLAGTVNGLGAITIEARRVGADLLLHRIIEMVEQAKLNPAPAERLAERAAAIFIPAVLAIAALAGGFWCWEAGLAKGGFVALAILVVACPCALGIATPLATALAIARAARAGVLVRGGDVLERLGKLRTVFFDKTGTITLNQPTVTAVESFTRDLHPDELLGWLAGLEAASEHGLGRALVAEARGRGIAIGTAEQVQACPGEGIRGRVNWQGSSRDVLAGTEKFTGNGAAAHASDGSATIVEVAWEGAARGRVLLADTIRADASAAVRQLREQGIASVVLSGDRRTAALAVAQAVGISQVEAPCRPEEKMALVRARPHQPAAMVGDGLNDAPALAAAEVGIVLGAGTDLARQAGNVVLLGDHLEQIPSLVALSRRARQIIVQNLLWAFGYNAVTLAAAALGWLHPLLAAVAMVVSSLTVISNSLRIQGFDMRMRES